MSQSKRRASIATAGYMPLPRPGQLKPPSAEDSDVGRLNGKADGVTGSRKESRRSSRSSKKEKAERLPRSSSFNDFANNNRSLPERKMSLTSLGTPQTLSRANSRISFSTSTGQNTARSTRSTRSNAGGQPAPPPSTGTVAHSNSQSATSAKPKLQKKDSWVPDFSHAKEEYICHLVCACIVDDIVEAAMESRKGRESAYTHDGTSTREGRGRDSDEEDEFVPPKKRFDILKRNIEKAKTFHAVRTGRMNKQDTVEPYAARHAGFDIDGRNNLICNQVSTPEDLGPGAYDPQEHMRHPEAPRHSLGVSFQDHSKQKLSKSIPGPGAHMPYRAEVLRSDRESAPSFSMRAMVWKRMYSIAPASNRYCPVVTARPGKRSMVFQYKEPFETPLISGTGIPPKKAPLRPQSAEPRGGLFSKALDNIDSELPPAAERMSTQVSTVSSGKDKQESEIDDEERSRYDYIPPFAGWRSKSFDVMMDRMPYTKKKVGRPLHSPASQPGPAYYVSQNVRATTNEKVSPSTKRSGYIAQPCWPSFNVADLHYTQISKNPAATKYRPTNYTLGRKAAYTMQGRNWQPNRDDYAEGRVFKNSNIRPGPAAYFKDEDWKFEKRVHVKRARIMPVDEKMKAFLEAQKAAEEEEMNMFAESSDEEEQEEEQITVDPEVERQLALKKKEERALQNFLTMHEKAYGWNLVDKQKKESAEEGDDDSDLLSEPFDGDFMT